MTKDVFISPSKQSHKIYTSGQARISQSKQALDYEIKANRITTSLQI
jgi:hypothetical protein